MKKPFIFLSFVLSGTLALQAAAVTFEEMPQASERVMPTKADQILSFSRAIDQAKDSIVYIATTQSKTQEYLRKVNPLIEEFFGRRYHPQIPKRQSLGSGVIATSDGYIITNSHVVKDADEIMVRIPGSEKEYAARIIGSDPKSDIAVIKVDAKGLKPIKMGSSAHLKIGDVVFAIGNPFGVGLSVTQGIISAQHKDSIGINEYENFIQTDASINPGNSGGALVDSRGALIGINSAIISSSGGNNGIGFAIEVDMVKNIARKLIEDGSVERGYLGVNIGNLTKELRQLYAHKEGALVIDLPSGSPASKAGLRRGDLITAVDSHVIEDASDLKNTIGMYRPGTKVSVTFERDKKDEKIDVTLGTLEGGISNQSGSLIDGLTLEPLTDDYRYRLKIPDDVEGVLVTEVDADAAAASQGVHPGDVIVQIEQEPVDSVKALAQALKKAGKGYKRVYLYRNGSVFVAALK